MTVEAWTTTPEYTIAGVGPYAITHPYVQNAIRASVRLDDGLLILNPTEFSVTPTVAEIEGNVFLSPAAAATHAGRKLLIDRVTPDEQGWVAVQGEREAGLAAQLNRMVQATQEVRAEVGGALRIRGVLDAFDLADGAVPLRDGDRIASGPTADQIAQAQARATEAAASAIAAAASAASAQARELSMLRDRGTYGTGILYSPSDIFTFNGESYITQTAHFATTVAADLTAGRIRIFAAKGAAGPGTGDMLKSESLASLASVPIARTNLGLGALAVKSLAAFADLDPAAIITALETLAANKTAENAVPTAKAVADYVDAAIPAAFAPTELPGSPFTLTGAAPFTALGIGSPRNLMICGINIGNTGSGRRTVRVGHAGGILTNNIYRRLSSLTVQPDVSDNTSGGRSFTLIICGFGTNTPYKAVIGVADKGSDTLIGIETAQVLDRVQIGNDAAGTFSGTLRLYGWG
jgi:hypothetical protein